MHIGLYLKFLHSVFSFMIPASISCCRSHKSYFAGTFSTNVKPYSPCITNIAQNWLRSYVGTILCITVQMRISWFFLLISISSHIHKRNFLLHVIEGQITEAKEVRRRTQLLDDLRNRRRYWELKEEVQDQKWSKWWYQMDTRDNFKLSSTSSWTC